MSKKRTVASEHRDYYQKNKAIVFESLLTAEQIDAASKEIAKAIGEKVKNAGVSQAFMAGHDLWRNSPLLQKIYSQSGIVAVVGDLLEKRPLRMGYDQYLPQATKYSKENDPYAAFLAGPATLQETSCLQEVACGVFFCLEGQTEGDLALIPGHGLVIAPDFIIPWEQLTGRYLLLVYVFGNAVYIEQPGDPHQHSLRQYGYIFGSRLNDKYHPIVLR